VAGREKRTRRRRSREGRPAPEPSPPAQSAAKSKDDLARERLEPLAEGERPLAVSIAAVMAALIALANLIGVAVAGSNAAGAVPFAALMTVAAVGMWRARYWAVLGFQVILAITVVYVMLFLIIRAGEPLEIAISVVALGICATLFWFLVRALARIQMPERRTS
jgi:hypothetical protein